MHLVLLACLAWWPFCFLPLWFDGVLGMIFLVCRYCIYTYRYMCMFMYTLRYRYRYRYVHA